MISFNTITKEEKEGFKDFVLTPRLFSELGNQIYPWFFCWQKWKDAGFVADWRRLTCKLSAIMAMLVVRDDRP